MKSNNSDKSTSNVCKEDVLMCIFKEVPDFVTDEGEDGGTEGWVGGSHQEVLVGRMKHSTDVGTSSSTRSKENDSTDRVSRKTRKVAEISHSSEELLLWSSIYPSQEALIGSAKKSQKSHKKAVLHEDCRKVVNAILSSDSVKSMEEKEGVYDGNNLEGSGQIDGSTETMRSEDEEGFARNSSLSTTTDLVSAEESRELVINKSQVMKLLNEAHTSILESSILLTTQKLHKKVNKTKEDNLEKDTPSDSDVLFDQIKAEEGTTKGTSKLCLVLGKLVTKYLKVK
ncbi:uncharacterized protein LOC124356311 [Homalodisca vitripennis]|uniref:uncharacterized protein LOC124356311 n=1 Tax=Homalodisca vitripennis TaxID=197043 RepID=UPI001EEC0BFF|nr:uncharacterized protein LOC124356311 [Homalodisca vitripennis]KAG8264144.1 hypothetical protein J6590_017162 [Homalodisca vitripennis]